MTHPTNAPMHLLRAVCAISLAIASTACGSEGHGGGGAGPAAPTNLRASAVGGGAHLVWADNADDETEYAVMRKLMGETSYTTVATVPFNTVQYHDGAIASGMTYVYHVMAMNEDGESASNEITFAAP